MEGLTEADVIAAEANVCDLLREPTCAAECDRYGDQETGRMVRLFRANLSFEDIGIELGITTQAATKELQQIWLDLERRWKEAAGRGRHSRLTRQERLEILRMHRHGADRIEIARRFGITTSGVRYVVGRYGGMDE